MLNLCRKIALIEGAKPTQLASSVPHVGVPEEAHIHEVEPEEGTVVCRPFARSLLQWQILDTLLFCGAPHWRCSVLPPLSRLSGPETFYSTACSVTVPESKGICDGCAALPNLGSSKDVVDYCAELMRPQVTATIWVWA